ncbi:MAG: hypothetical protein H7A51_14885 [Akkermansiaceae bacterium]|nr:hypothetical protein [Akkermansiaceae bacterium]
MSHHTRLHTPSMPARPNLAGNNRMRRPTGLTGLLLAFFVILSTLPQAGAQVAVRLQMNKSNYILNEPVTATVHITNHSGRQLVLRTENSRPWLNFHITSSGRVIPIARQVNYGNVVIPSGQTVARNVSLNVSYALGSMGNYTCQAVVNMPGLTRNGFTSNRAHFTVTNGRTVWVQRAGIPKAPGEIREYQLMTFTGNRAMELFAHVSSSNRGQNIATIPLGKILTFHRPTGTLDRDNNMHAIYQVKPDLFGHTCITPNGQVKFTSYHKRGASGDPRLVDLGDGVVRVAGGVPYSAEAEAEQERKIHNISERPPFIYK